MVGISPISGQHELAAIGRDMKWEITESSRLALTTRAPDWRIGVTCESFSTSDLSMCLATTPRGQHLLAWRKSRIERPRSHSARRTNREEAAVVPPRLKRTP